MVALTTLRIHLMIYLIYITNYDTLFETTCRGSNIMTHRSLSLSHMLDMRSIMMSLSIYCMQPV